MLKKFLFILFPLFSFGQNTDLLKKGDFFFNKSVNDSAVFYYSAGIKDCKKCDEILLANYYLKFGEANRLIGNKSIALENFLRAEKNFLELNDNNGLVEAKVFLAEFYRFINNFEKSFSLIEEAAEIIEENTISKKVLAYYYNRRAAIISQKFDDKEEVIRLSKECLLLAKEIKEYRLIIYSYNELGYVYGGQGKKDLALSYYFKAYDIAKQFNLKIEMCDVLYNISNVEVYLADAADKNKTTPGHDNPDAYKKAQKYFKEGLALANEINYLEKQRDFSKDLFKTYLYTHQYEEAMKYNQIYYAFEGLMLTNDKKKEIAEIEAKYLDEKKDNQIKENERRIKLQYFILFAFGLLLILLFFFFIKSKKDRINIQHQKKKIEEVLAQKTVLLKEIHHRVKNNLQLTSSLLYLQSNKHNDPKISEMVKESQKHINSIALVHEMLYQDDALSLIAMDKYLKELGVRLLQFSSDKNIIYNLNFENISLPIDYATTLGLILNELMTNSLKYAFKENTGEISVHLEKNQENQYTFIYADNGVGLENEIPKKPQKTLGLKLIKMFAEEMDAELEVKTEKGLTYTFIFKNKYDIDE